MEERLARIEALLGQPDPRTVVDNVAPQTVFEGIKIIRKWIDSLMMRMR